MKRTATKTKKQKSKEKQPYRYSKQQVGKILLQKTRAWLRKKNLQIETESLLIAAQNNAITTN